MKKIALSTPTMHQVLNQNLSARAVNLGGAFLDKAYSKEQVLLTPIYYTLSSALCRRRGFLLHPLNS